MTTLTASLDRALVPSRPMCQCQTRRVSILRCSRAAGVPVAPHKLTPRLLTKVPATGAAVAEPCQVSAGLGREQEVAEGAWAPPPDRRGVYDSAGRLVLKCLTLSELEAWCAAQGEEAPAKRALQLWRWMYADPPAGAWIRSLGETLGRQGGLAGKFVERHGAGVTLEGGLALREVVRAGDGTRKLVFEVTQGEAKGGSVETVIIPVVRQRGLRDRLTVCVSSQVGCAMNCQFCFTGRMGLLGNLTTAQIVEQVVEARRLLAQEGDRTPLTNIVYMGMGEPLHNLDAVISSVDIVSHYLGLHISHNKATISTVGLVPELREVVKRTRAQIAVSLHGTTDEVRDWIVPVNRRYDLATLTSALRELFPQPQPQRQRQQLAARALQEPAPGAAAPSPSASSSCQGDPTAVHAQQQAQEQCQGTTPEQPTAGSSTSEALPSKVAAADGPPLHMVRPARASEATTSSSSRSAPAAESSGTGGDGDRSLLIGYTMLRGINDTQEDAHRLVALLSGINCKVNLIVFNPHAGTRFQPSTDEDVCAFRSILIQQGLVCTIRDSRGDDEMAACGQLGNVGLAFRPPPIIDAPERFRDLLLPPQPLAQWAQQPRNLAVEADAAQQQRSGCQC